MLGSLGGWELVSVGISNWLCIFMAIIYRRLSLSSYICRRFCALVDRQLCVRLAAFD